MDSLADIYADALFSTYWKRTYPLELEDNFRQMVDFWEREAWNSSDDPVPEPPTLMDVGIEALHWYRFRTTLDTIFDNLPSFMKAQIIQN